MQLALPLAEQLPAPAEAGGLAIAVDIVRSRRRTLAIHVSALGKVEVRAPLRSDPHDIRRFLDQHRRWVLRKLDEFASRPPWVPRWQAGGDWYWQGRSLQLVPGSGRATRLDDGCLQVVRAGSDAQLWRRRVLDWHRRTAQPLLEARVRELFALHYPHDRLREVECRWMRATWGTCTARRLPDGRRDVKIRLNLWLAALPPALAEAVMFHELAHVDHMHHGVAFYRRLARLDPEWRQHDHGLRDWARRLFPVAARGLDLHGTNPQVS